MLHGIEPDVAVDGMEALKMVQEKSYDLVFMDHMMPVMDGIESITCIRALGGAYTDLPIVVLSANAISDAVKSFFDAGANDFLPKPIEDKRLNEMLARWLPPEKVRMGKLAKNEAKAAEAKGGGDELRRELSGIGLDVDQGLRYTSGREAYIRILCQTCDELPGTVDIIKSFLEIGDLHEYGIRVHAMKSVFAMIGSESVSKAAYRLEMAAKSGDAATCHAETEALCDAMLSFRQRFLGTSYGAADSSEKEEIGADALKQTLEVMKEACLLGKVDEINDLMQTLKRATLNEETDARLEEILRLLNSFDYETAAEQITELTSALPQI
jgi:CheY-like chemotaxis protein